MAQYIDKAAIMAEIERLKGILQDYAFDGVDWQDYRNGGLRILNVLSKSINSLQQEQPEVELEKEFRSFLDKVGAPVFWCDDEEQIEWMSIIARHFYELGQLNTKKEETKQPEPYFYCKYGGIMPLCSDCKRNYSNSPFKAGEITTWYAPENGTKKCSDYINKEHPETKLDRDEIIDYTHQHYYYDKDFDGYGHSKFRPVFTREDLIDFACHFYKLGLNRRK